MKEMYMIIDYKVGNDQLIDLLEKGGGMVQTINTEILPDFHKIDRANQPIQQNAQRESNK